MISNIIHRASAVVIAIAAIMAAGCGSHGTKLEFKGGELYYLPPVNAEEANKLGKFFIDDGFFDGNMKTVQLRKEGSTYEVRMVVKKGIEQDQEFVNIFKIYVSNISKVVFNGSKVDIHLCDEHLVTLKTIVSVDN